MGCAKKVCQTLIARYLRDTRKSPERGTSRPAARCRRSGGQEIPTSLCPSIRCDRGPVALRSARRPVAQRLRLFGRDRIKSGALRFIVGAATVGPVALRENCKRLPATILIVTASCALTYPSRAAAQDLKTFNASESYLAEGQSITLSQKLGHACGGGGWRVWKPAIQQTSKSALLRLRLGRAVNLGRQRCRATGRQNVCPNGL